MQTMRAYSIYRKILSVLLVLSLFAGMFCFDSSPAGAKGSLSPDDYVKNVLVYVKNSAGDEVLISQLNVSEMLTYLNDHFETYGKVHNYSILDRLVTPVHQEAQGFTVGEMLDYAAAKSTLANISQLGLSFNGEDSVSFWEIDGNDFDAVDTYTHNDLYGVTRYNFPALYENWNYTSQAYANQSVIWQGRQEEQVLLSITAYSQRYIVSGLYDTGEYNMENYFDSQGLLDTARTVRLMLPMTEVEFMGQTSTANNSRYGICYILFDPVAKPDFSLGEVAEPTYTVTDGDADENDQYESGYWYFTLSCATEGATIYYNDNSGSNYMPTAVYTPGQAIKQAKNGMTPGSLLYRAVKEGCSDAGIQTASSNGGNSSEEEVDPGASVWDGTSVDTSWYAGHENDASYTISTAAQLAGLASLANNSSGTGAVTFAGKTVNLVNNIHLNRKDWSPIGDHTDATITKPGGVSYDTSQYYSFNGTFNGNGFTVSGLNVYEQYYNAYWGLFGKTVNATIRDLTVSGTIGVSCAKG